MSANTRGSRPTMILAHPRLALVVDCKPDSPCWQVAQYYRAETSVHATQTLIFPYNTRRTDQAFVHPVVTHVIALIEGIVTALRLEFRLDDIEGTGHYTRGKASYCAGQGIKLRVGSAHSPALEWRQHICVVGGHVGGVGWRSCC